VIAALCGVALLALFQLYRRRATRSLDRLDITELGLELMTGCCAFVVFTTPACRPCKAALRVVEAAAERRPGLTEVTTIDAMERSDLTLRYDVRSIPTVFLITASGHVIERWKKVPQPTEVETALASM
jgi:thioredoxin-like negative regulator of GroEL